MSALRRSVAIAAAAVLLASLVGCATTTGTPASRGSTASDRTDARMSLVSPSPNSTSTHVEMVAAPPRAKVPSCASNKAGVKHIYVNIAEQLLWTCAGVDLVTVTSVTTGAWKIKNANDVTPTGTWRIYGKMRNVVLSGHDANGSWHDHVAYWMPFYGPYGFHDASWQTFPYGSPLFSTEGSHGCVHVPVAVLATIFNWAPIGTLVTIVTR